MSQVAVKTNTILEQIRQKFRQNDFYRQYLTHCYEEDWKMTETERQVLKEEGYCCKPYNQIDTTTEENIEKTCKDAVVSQTVQFLMRSDPKLQTVHFSKKYPGQVRDKDRNVVIRTTAQYFLAHKEEIAWNMKLRMDWIRSDIVWERPYATKKDIERFNTNIAFQDLAIFLEKDEDQEFGIQYQLNR